MARAWVEDLRSLRPIGSAELCDTLPLEMVERIQGLTAAEIISHLDSIMGESPRDAHMEQMGRSMLSRLLELEPRACLAWMLDNHMPFHAKGLLKPLFRRLSEADTAEAIDAVSALRMKSYRELAWKGILDASSEAEAHDVRSALERCDRIGPEAFPAKRALLTRLASIDIRAAGEYALEAVGRSRKELLALVARTGGPDPEGTIAWAQSSLRGSEQWQFMREFVSGTVDLSESQFDKIAAMLPNGATKNALYAEFAAKRAREDVANALEWTKQLPSSSARSIAESQIAVTLKMTNPGLALKLAADLPSTQFESEFFYPYARKQALRSIDETIRKASQIDDPYQQHLFLSATVGVAAERSLETASGVLGRMENRSDYLDLVSVAAMHHGMVDAEATADWLLGLPENVTAAIAPVYLEHFGPHIDESNSLFSYLKAKEE